MGSIVAPVAKKTHMRCCSPNRFTCMGFLLLRKGCLPWSYDFDCVSGLASSECFLHLSFICLPLVSHSGSGWWHDFPSLSPFCLSFVSHSGTGRWHDFTSLSHSCLALVFDLSHPLGQLGLINTFTCLPFVFHLSSTCLPLWVRLVAWLPSLVSH
jgi:hypothetical protein